MPADSLYNEHELFREIAGGNESAFTEVFFLYSGRIHAYLLRKVQSEAIAREMLQDVFLKLWIYREALKKVHSPRAYLYRIVANHLQDHFRKLGRERRMHQHLLQANPAQESTTEADLYFSETSRIYEATIRGLSPQRRNIYMLRQEGFSYEEIAVKLGISPNTVKNQLIIAGKFVRESLRRQGLGIILFLVAQSHIQA